MARRLFSCSGANERNVNERKLFPIDFRRCFPAGVHVLCLGAIHVFFQNFDNGIDAPVFDAESNRLSGPIYVAELWGGVNSSSLSPTLDFSSGQRVIVPFYTGIGAGYFSSSASSLTVQTQIAGAFAWVQVRAWDARLGSTYEQVAALGAGGYGESQLLYLAGGNPDALVPPQNLTGLQSFSLRPVPESSVWQLSLLGLSTVLLMRRKGK